MREEPERRADKHAPDAQRDGVAVRRIARFGIGILIAVAAVVASVIALTRRLDPAPAGGFMAPPKDWVSGPMLESAPQSQLSRYLAGKQAQLQGYAWIDRQAGIARIPLDDAMQALAEQDAARRSRTP
ncbi:hypothetical protein [Bordetella genomosp. 9]|uniref:Uncharacterized protein n=1 Tax=Bordetella genomosp. 9 TaxID=1416803 RepID=A0A1W6Z2M8_9BORD|nr:hypothetical protein [Bordetella genomosp. 9]ARP87501.1 hypothetical protein CAL13_15775 [Bordetella genomosp. 9]